MIKSAFEFETLVVKVLKTITSDDDLTKLESCYKDADISEALDFCIENNFLIGFVSNRNAYGSVILERKKYTFVTYDGLKFIEAFNGEETSMIAKNAEKKSKIAIGISALSLFVAIFSNLDKIIANISKFLDFLLN